MISFIIPGEPVAFARAGARGPMRFTPKKQSSHMSLIRLAAYRAMDGQHPLEGALWLDVVSVSVPPQSWSKPKRSGAIGASKTTRPDLDNIIKIIKDALNEVVWLDDAQVAEITARKVYGEIAETRVVVQVLDAAMKAGRAA